MWILEFKDKETGEWIEQCREEKSEDIEDMTLWDLLFKGYEVRLKEEKEE